MKIVPFKSDQKNCFRKEKKEKIKCPMCGKKYEPLRAGHWHCYECEGSIDMAS